MNKDTKNALVSFALVIGIASAGSVAYSQKVQAEQVMLKKETNYTEQQKESELIMQELVAKWSASEEIKEAPSTAQSTEEPVVIESTKVAPVTKKVVTPTPQPAVPIQAPVDTTAVQVAQAKANALAKQAQAKAQADALAQQITDAKRAAAALAARNAAIAAQTPVVQPSRVSAAS